jgi:hypothetical protein
VSSFPPGYERHSLDLPVRFGRFDLMGYELSANQLYPGSEVILATFWRVQESPEPPLDLFVHMLDAAGQVVGQHDGLDVDPVGLAPGDTFVQVHRFRVPPDASPGEYPLEVGIYRPDTMQRWPVLGESGVVGDRLLLAPIRVEGK